MSRIVPTQLYELFTGGFTWIYPWILVLLPILWLLFFVLKSKKPAAFTFSDLSEIRNVKGMKVKLLKYLPILKLIGLSFIIIALARPKSFLKDETIKANGIDIILALDVSSSMLSKDFEPDRLSAAKSVATDFINRRPYDRIGLVIFSGEAFTQCPATADHDVLKQMLSIVEPGILTDGTAIGMGLATAVNRLKNSKAKSKVIILMTDGVNNAGYIKPETAQTLAKTMGVKVYTIGIGSTGQALTPVARRFDGSYVYGVSNVEIDEKLLVGIAEATGGKYFRAHSGEELSEIYNYIDKLEKSVIDIKTMKKFSEEFRFFLLIGLGFITLAVLLKYFYVKPLTN